MRAFDVAAKQMWAIASWIGPDGEVEAPALEQILSIAERAHQPDFEAVAQRQAERADQSGIREMRGSVAVINVTGPIFRYASLFTAISGATSVEMLATAFRAALDDPAASAIVLNIDSPGGQVAGISELATAIFEARAVKPIVAYADDLAASGAYWLASAANRIVASDTAQLGSIGVVANLDVRSKGPNVKSYQFVSSVSPKKRPDLETDEGRATIQERIDDLAAVFVSTVARNRGVSEDHVRADFGQGGVLIAAKAIAAGMADEIGTFEGLIATLDKQGMGGSAVHFQQGVIMEQPNSAEAAQTAAPAQPPIDVDAVRRQATEQAIVAERARIGAILASPEAEGREQLARTIALETGTTPEAAKKLLSAAPKAVQVAPNPLAEAMAGVKNPQVGSDAGDGEEDVAAAVRATVALYQGVK
jgi:signal peptide peptidase SppA